MDRTKLEKLRDRLKTVPDIEMYHWVSQSAVCGTAGCLAGWTLLMATDQAKLDKPYADRNINQEHACYPKSEKGHPLYQAAAAEKLLDLTPLEGKRLWYTENWPKEFEKAYDDVAYGDGKRAAASRRKIAVARLDHFIQTGE